MMMFVMMFMMIFMMMSMMMSIIFCPCLINDLVNDVVNDVVNDIFNDIVNDLVIDLVKDLLNDFHKFSKVFTRFHKLITVSDRQSWPIARDAIASKNILLPLYTQSRITYMYLIRYIYLYTHHLLKAY